jgi:hypothetical protein
MTIRYGGRAASISIVLGVVATLWSPVMASIELGHFVGVGSLYTVLGVVALLGGILMLSGRKYVTIDNEAVVIHALVGPIKRRFAFASWREVTIEGHVLRISGVRIPVHRTQANGGDWHDFERFVAARTVGNGIVAS